MNRVLGTCYLGLATVCLLVAAPAFAQGRRGGGGGEERRPPAWMGNGELTGKVADESGKGVADAKVSFVYAPSNTGFTAKTNRNGEFKAKDMKAGEWRVQVEAANFPTWRQVVQVAAKNNPAVSVQLKHDNSPELIATAEGLYKAGQYGEARAEYMKVLEAHPELTGINRAIAFTYGREKNHAEALKYLDLALASNPNDPTLLQLAAASAMEVKDFPRAMGYLAKIDDAALDSPQVLADAAVNLINAGRAADGITVLDRVIARFPGAADLYFFRGFAHLKMDKDAEGKADLEKFVSMAPPDAPMLPRAKELLAAVK